jgi:hypothetical protein
MLIAVPDRELEKFTDNKCVNAWKIWTFQNVIRDVESEAFAMNRCEND